jgi:hypothetical protein
MLDPDLSMTLPEKLPAAWPYNGEALSRARKQRIRTRNVPRHFTSVDASADWKHSAENFIGFMV